MSYLLDALKQSQQADMSAEQYDLQSAQLKQQQALTFAIKKSPVATWAAAIGSIVLP